jgi:DNA-binding NarL/FixJ family response regulator
VWLDESNVIFRCGMASCLTEAGFAIAGQSAHLAPMPDLDTTEVLVVELNRAALVASTRLCSGTGMRLVGVAGDTSSDLVQDAVKAGFAGLLIRSDLTPAKLVATIRAVACGTGSIPPTILARLLTDPGRAAGSRETPGVLARRELAVLRLLAKGSSTREIAGELCYSERTVKNIVHDTLTKLNCRTRAHAVAVVARQGAL